MRFFLGALRVKGKALKFIFILSVTEAKGVASLPLTRTRGNFGQVSVNYLTYPVTAIEGEDYVRPSSVVVFGDGVRSAFINITILDDSQLEYEETFRVQLVGTAGKNTKGITIELVSTLRLLKI